jgi:hypothetical protein
MPKLISLNRDPLVVDVRETITREDLQRMIADYTMNRYRPFKKAMQKQNPKYNDARACWFDTRVFLELLGFDKPTVEALESQVRSQGISGIRIYYGVTLIEVIEDNRKKHSRHNLVMVATTPKVSSDMISMADKVEEEDLVAFIDEDLPATAQNGGNLCPPCIGGTLMIEVDEILPPEELENQLTISVQR